MLHLICFTLSVALAAVGVAFEYGYVLHKEFIAAVALGVLNVSGVLLAKRLADIDSNIKVILCIRVFRILTILCGAGFVRFKMPDRFELFVAVFVLIFLATMVCEISEILKKSKETDIE